VVLNCPVRERRRPPRPRRRARASRSASARRRARAASRRLDLNEILILHPEAAFLCASPARRCARRASTTAISPSSTGALEAGHGQVVIAVHHDEFLCRRLCRSGDALGLQATDPVVAPVWASEGDAFDVWGVVTHVVKQVST
jgi:DNA polymerase V